MSEKKFSGRSAIVTGATRGIGRAIALELAKEGASVAFNYSKSADEAEKLKGELADVTIEFLKPIQERVRGIDDDKLDAILEQGAEKAEAIARATLNQAKKNMGLIGSRK